MRETSRRLEEFDVETGKKLFQPQVNSKSRIEKREKPVWDELYENSKKRLDSPQVDTKKVLVDKNSQKINQKIRYKQFSRIFQDLSANGEYIKFQDIDFSKADKKMKSILDPLFREMEESLIELTFSEFCQALDALFRVLTPQEKGYLLFNYSNTEFSKQK